MKRLVIILSFTVLLFTNMFVFPIYKASALTIPNITQATKIIRAIGEKIGVNWTTASLAAATGYLANDYKSFMEEGNTGQLPFWWAFGTVPDTIPITNDGDLSKYKITPEDFKTGVTAIKKADDNLKEGAVVPTFGKCEQPVLDPSGNPIVVNTGKMVVYDSGDTGMRIFTWSGDDAVWTKTTTIYSGVKLGDWISYKQHNGGWIPASSGNSTASINLEYNPSFGPLMVENYCDRTVKSTDDIDISLVDGSLYGDNADYNYYNDYEITINNVNDGTDNIDTYYTMPFTPLEIENIGGGAVVVVPDEPKGFTNIMVSMANRLTDTYNGVIKFFGDSVAGMEKLMVGSAGLVAFMTGFFDIFPQEFTNVITVGFMMGFIMYFFRR